MSQSQVARAGEVGEYCIRRFLKSEQAKALLGKDYQFGSLIVAGSDKPVKVIPINIASEFWMAQAFKGNTKADWERVNRCSLQVGATI